MTTHQKSTGGKSGSTSDKTADKTADKASDKASGGSASSSKQSDQGGSRGGTHEQHVEAGRQSHKNDDSAKSGNKQSAGDSKNR